MDYKYIEQLIERYFQSETTLQEEQILSAFFAQDVQSLPQSLRRYQSLFAALKPEDTLGSDFDNRMMSLIEEPAEQSAAPVVSISHRLRPLFRAAAIVAIVVTLGNAMNMSLQQSQSQADDINYANYKDTYDDPAMAYDKVENALQLISEGFIQVQRNDSLRIDSLYSELK